MNLLLCDATITSALLSLVGPLFIWREQGKGAIKARGLGVMAFAQGGLL